MSETVKSEPYKSSAEILSELFSSFNAKPPNIEEKILKKMKKSKKKHKHKDKKHKKKSKHKHKGSESEESDSSGSSKRNKHKKKKNKDKVAEKLAADLDLSRVKNEPKSKDKDAEKTADLDLSRVKNEPGEIKKDSASNSPVNINKQSKHAEEETSESIVSVKDAENTDKNSSNTKISIKNLKHSTVYEATLKEIEDQAKEKASKFEEGEVTESESEDDDLEGLIKETISKRPEKKKRKHSSCKHRDKFHESSKEKKSKLDNEDSKKPSKSDKDRHSHKSSRKSRSRSKEKLERERHSSSRRERDKNDYYYGSSRHYADTNYDRYNNYKFASRDYRRSRTPDRLRSRSGRDIEKRRRSKSPTSSIDKKKLLEIARKNAISMLKSGTLPEALTLGPQAQEKVIAAIKAGGKTIEELTDFCKNLSKKEELGELSSVSSNDEEDDDVENEKVFHHPFQLKDKPTSIVMNIKNATPLPVKTSKEKTAELRMQFPVSSGQLHRKTENEWVPVTPKKFEAPLAIMPAPPPPVPAPAPTPVPKPVPAPLPVAPPPEIPALLPPPLPPIFDMDLSGAQSDVDISSIVSQRLAAMRKLQENPNDVQALNQIYRAQKEVSAWAESKQQPGQFTGSTGAHILTPAELSSGYQAWARKDQLQNAAPVTGGMGMHLLQKMGWKPGEGLGKEKTGSLVPLLLEVKLDKKGLVATEEVKGKKFTKTAKPTGTIKTLAGKHPVSLLGEFATKRKLGAPTYELCFECGPDHKKNFLFKVLLNGIEYKANVASSTKKQAKADAATVCLQKLGVLIS